MRKAEDICLRFHKKISQNENQFSGEKKQDLDTLMSSLISFLKTNTLDVQLCRSTTLKLS